MKIYNNPREQKAGLRPVFCSLGLYNNSEPIKEWHREEYFL
jgi:hypothetical protein